METAPTLTGAVGHCPLRRCADPGRRRSRRRQAANVRPKLRPGIFRRFVPASSLMPLGQNRVSGLETKSTAPSSSARSDLSAPFGQGGRSSPPASGAGASAAPEKVKPIHLGHFDVERNDIGLRSRIISRDQRGHWQPRCTHVALAVDDFVSKPRTNAESSTTTTRIFSNRTSEQINGSTGSGLSPPKPYCRGAFRPPAFPMEGQALDQRLAG